MKRIAVIGGNAAGPGAAAKAKRVNPSNEVVLFEAGEFISTGTCELPYLISGHIKDYKDILFYSPESFFAEKNVKVYNKHFVESIDRKEKKIIVRNLISGTNFTYNYDKLILTTGSVPVRHPAFSNSYKNVFYLKNVSDFIKIKEFLSGNKCSKVLIVGAGYIGIETAEAFKNLGMEVSVIDKETLPLASMDSETSSLAYEILKTNGIEFTGGVKDISIFDNNGNVTKVKFNSISYDFDLILISVGFLSNIQLASGARLDIGKEGGIRVDRKLKTSDPDIYAAGDCIEVKNKINNRFEYIPLASIAHTYGHIAGANAAGDNLFADEIVKNIAVKIFNKTLVSVGLNSEEASASGFRASAVMAVLPNLVTVMPESSKTFGKIIFETGSKRILGAQFLGNNETVGYGDLISSLIYQKSDASLLSRFNFNYSPPCSPFINLLSVLGRKIEGFKL